MQYEFYFYKEAEKQLKRLHPIDKARILKVLNQLKENPRPEGKKVKRLVEKINTWRIRVGKARAIYFIDDAKKEIWVMDVKYRKEIYR